MANRPSRLLITAPTISAASGRYEGRWPHGDKPSSGAISGNALGNANAGGQLTTGIRLAGTASDVATAGASLGSFTANSGWSQVSGTFGPGQTFTIGRGAADLGTGPTVVAFTDFRGGTVGNVVSTTPTVGATAFEMTDSAGGTIRSPVYATGPDGDTWMNLMSSSLGAADQWSQANLNGLPDFDTFFIAYNLYADFTNGDQSGSNQKDLWVTRNGNVSGAGHDIFVSRNWGIFSNTNNPTIYLGGSSSSDHPGQEPLFNGFWQRNVQQYRSIGLKPHTTAAVNALCDTFVQTCNSSESYSDTSTGLVGCWGSASVTPAWNQVYLLGYYQDQSVDHSADPPHLTYYLIKDYYVATGANAWKRFIITDAPTIASSRSMFCVYASTWSANQVSLRIPYGLPSYIGRYVWYANGNSYSLVGHT